MVAYIEMLSRNGSFAICVVSLVNGNILTWSDGFAVEELPHFEKSFSGNAKFYQVI